MRRLLWSENRRSSFVPTFAPPNGEKPLAVHQTERYNASRHRDARPRNAVRPSCGVQSRGNHLPIFRAGFGVGDGHRIPCRLSAGAKSAGSQTIRSSELIEVLRSDTVRRDHYAKENQSSEEGTAGEGEGFEPEEEPQGGRPEVRRGAKGVVIGRDHRWR